MKAFKRVFLIVMVLILLLLASCKQSVHECAYLDIAEEELLAQYPEAIVWHEFLLFQNEESAIVLVEYDDRDTHSNGKLVCIYPARDTLPTKAECEKISKGMSIYEVIACLGMPSSAFNPSGRYPGFAYTTVEGDSFLVLINGFPNTVFQTSFPVIPESSPYEDESKPNT